MASKHSHQNSSGTMGWVLLLLGEGAGSGYWRSLGGSTAGTRPTTDAVPVAPKCTVEEDLRVEGKVGNNSIRELIKTALGWSWQNSLCAPTYCCAPAIKSSRPRIQAAQLNRGALGRTRDSRDAKTRDPTPF